VSDASGRGVLGEASGSSTQIGTRRL